MLLLKNLLQGYCPEFSIHDLVSDETDPQRLRVRANFSMAKSEVFIGELIGQSVELEFSDNGIVKLAKCDNCAWNESLKEYVTLKRRNIGPLMRGITYVPIINVKSQFKIMTDGYSDLGTVNHKCRGKPFMTMEWPCADGQQKISFNQVCDNPEKPDCNDKSDEDDLRCKAGVNWGLLAALAAYWFLGYLFTLPLLYSLRPLKKHSHICTESNQIMIEYIDKELVRILQTKRDFTDCTNLSVFERDLIKTKYLQMKANGKIDVMFELLRDTHALPTIEKVMIFLQEVEIQYHQYPSKDKVYTCMMVSIKDNPLLKQWVIDHFKQGFGYQVKKKILVYFPKMYGMIEWFERKCIVAMIMQNYKILSAKLDTWKDLVLFLACRHYCDFILVSWFQITNTVLSRL